MIICSAPDSWVLETRHTAYALGLNYSGLLVHRYWGPRLPRAEDYQPADDSSGWASFNGPAQLVPEEYPAWGGMRFINPCLKVSYADGTRDLLLKFEGAEVLEQELKLHLVDAAYALEVILHYRPLEQYDLIERRVTLINHGPQPLTIERIASAQWHLPPGDGWRLTHLSGRWAEEFQIQQQPLKPGLLSLESRRGFTSHHHSPWFALDRGLADEENGEVWFGALGWSGSWKNDFEVTEFHSTRVNTGLNDWDFAWRLDPDESFISPPAYAGYTQKGWGAASRSFHDFIRSDLLPHRRAIHKILYNSWEATTFDVDEPSQIRLAEIAAAMGVELFVMDDGWFHGRKDDSAGLGDWWPDEKKFPRGLAPLSERVHALGMDFGLWIEPEMVNPDSDLYRAHPEWAIQFPSRIPTTARNQLVLNMARADVQSYLFEKIDALLSSCKIDFIKWDANRNISEPGWPDSPGDPRELWVRYTQGVYSLWSRLRTRYPNVIWQACSGGGGRADLGILRQADQIWTSDNTDAVARLAIQDGFSQLFPACTMEAWVTDQVKERLSLDFRFHVAMCGTLGLGSHLLHWNRVERETAAHWIRIYKEIRPIVQLGDQYRLRPPRTSGFSALQYVSKDQTSAVLFAFRTHLPEPAWLAPLQLRGLDPEGLYEVEGFKTPRSGQAWMHTGLTLELRDFESTLRRIQRIG